MTQLASPRFMVSRRHQSGVVLITAVMILIVLTILVLSTMRAAIIEERMVATSRDWNIAFQAAETALRDAEREIKNGTRIAGETGFVADCSASTALKGPGLCMPNLCTDASATSTDCTPIWIALSTLQSDAGWKSGSGTTKSVQYGAYTSAPSLAGVGAQPRYIVEVLTVPDASSLKVNAGTPSQKYLYRVTAVGFGADVKSRVMLQGVYRPY